MPSQLSVWLWPSFRSSSESAVRLTVALPPDPFERGLVRLLADGLHCTTVHCSGLQCGHSAKPTSTGPARSLTPLAFLGLPSLFDGGTWWDPPQQLYPLTHSPQPMAPLPATTRPLHGLPDHHLTHASSSP